MVMPCADMYAAVRPLHCATLTVTLTRTVWTKHWHTAYSRPGTLWQRFCFSTPFCFRVRSPYRQTDGRARPVMQLRRWIYDQEVVGSTPGRVTIEWLLHYVDEW